MEGNENDDLLSNFMALKEEEEREEEKEEEEEYHSKIHSRKKKKKDNQKKTLFGRIPRPHLRSVKKLSTASNLFGGEGGGGSDDDDDGSGGGGDSITSGLTGMQHNDLDRHRRMRKFEMVKYNYPHRYEHRHEPKPEDYSHITPSKFINGNIYTLAIRLNLLWSFAHLITPHGIVVMALTMACTWLCWYKEWQSDAPITVISASIIFPVSFG